VDGSVFEPGVPAEMTTQQTRAFFKFQAHDPATLRTVMANILSHKYSEEPLSTGSERALNFVAKNRLAASRTPMRSTTRSLSGSTSRRRRASPAALLEDGAGLIDARSRGRVESWLRGASAKERAAFQRVMSALDRETKAQQGRVDAPKAPPASAPPELAERPRSSSAATAAHGGGEARRPGTASLLERSEREVERAVAVAAERAGPSGA
jgi:hypothetical protein